MKNYSARLFDLYKNNIQSSLKEKLDIKNVMELPKIEKNCFKHGVGDAKDKPCSSC